MKDVLVSIQTAVFERWISSYGRRVQMSGGYISCGKGLGDDKSGTAFFFVLEELERLVREPERSEWRARSAQLDEIQDDEPTRVEIPPTMMSMLARVVQRYVERETARGVIAEPDEST